MDLSTESRSERHASLNRQIRQLIAGTILFNQKVADRVGFHLTDMQCVNVLDLLGPTTPGKLAECTGLTTGGVTVMLDRLEKAGFVKRAPNPKDRRSVMVSVNPKHLKKIQAHYAGIERETLDVFAEFTEEELAVVARFLARLNAIRAERGPLQ